MGLIRRNGAIAKKLRFYEHRLHRVWSVLLSGVLTVEAIENFLSDIGNARA